MALENADITVGFFSPHSAFCLVLLATLLSREYKDKSESLLLVLAYDDRSVLANDDRWVLANDDRSVGFLTKVFVPEYVESAVGLYDMVLYLRYWSSEFFNVLQSTSYTQHATHPPRCIIHSGVSFGVRLSFGKAQTSV